MNSDPFSPDSPSPPDTIPAETATPARTRRRGTRRSTARVTPDRATEPEPAVDTAVGEETMPAPPAPTSARQGTRTATGDAPTGEARPRRSRARVTTPTPAEPASSTEIQATAPAAPIEQVMAPPASDVLTSEAAPGGEIAGEEARPRRRRRGRGGRAAAAEDIAGADVLAAAEAAPTATQEASLAAATPTETEVATTAEVSGVGTSRRRRRRGRGGRGGTAEAEAEDLAAIDVADQVTAPTHDLAEPDLTTREPGEAAQLSPAVLRRFDHRNWRDRPGRLAAPGRAAAVAAAPEPAVPVPFGRRSDRGTRYGRRHAPHPDEPAAPQMDVGQTAAPPVTPPPIVMPAQPGAAGHSAAAAPSAGMSARPDSLTAVPFAPVVPQGGSVEERLERLLVGQTTLLQQQQQALQSMVSTMAALRGSIERMSTTGIAAGMPRAGVFVDAPNVVYAAESARVAIDYGRMLDFLGRGRELVHAIVYAPVTEEAGFRFEGQRFVAPFLHKGYKLVTKPLKRFPDGTAKGNFDIELAIDIVTMSQRLDVVILISGDSDFSRLIELIQSRGVRVEVVAFAANVSWELVQMADVFIDIGQYLPEFQPA